MDDRVIQFRVGVLVFATAIITCFLILLIGGWMPGLPLFGGIPKTIYIKFAEAPGVSIDTPIRKSGILIGRVTAIDLRDDGTVLVTARIDADRKILRSEECRISAGNFLGDSVIEFIRPEGNVTDLALLEDGEFLVGTVSVNPLRVLERAERNMNDAMRSLTRAGDDVGLLARGVNASFENNQDQFQRIIRKAELALDGLTLAADNLNTIMGDKESVDRLKQVLRDIPDAIASAKRTFQEAEVALGSLKKAGESAERNLTNLEGFTGPLGQRGPQIVANVENSIRRLDHLMEELQQFGAALNEGNGALSRFVNDPELYQQLNKAAGNIEEITGELRPIIADARVFMDKIARDPGRIGVKGALDRSQTGPK